MATDGTEHVNGAGKTTPHFGPNDAGDWFVEGCSVALLDAADARYLLQRWANPRDLAEIGVRTERDGKAIAAALNLSSYRGTAGLLWPIYEYPYRSHAEPLSYVFRQRTPNGGHKVLRPKRTGDRDTVVPVVGPRTMLDRRWGNPTFDHVITEGEGKVAALDRAGFAVLGCGGVDTFHDPVRRTVGEGFVLRPAWHRLMRMAVEGLADCGIEGKVERVVLCFDADINTNPQVLTAAQRLAGSLRSETYQLHVALAVPPVVEGNEKTGIDDVARFIELRGEDPTEDLQRIIGEAGYLKSIQPAELTARSGGEFCDDYVANLLADFIAEHHRWCPQLKCWLTWTGTHWCFEPPQSDACVREAYGQLCAAYDARVSDAMGEGRPEAEVEQLSKFAWSLRQLHRRTAFLKDARECPRLRVDAAKLDVHPGIGLLNTPTGTIELETGRLRAHDKRDYLTAVSPVAYRPGAKSELWDGILRGMWPVDEHRQYVQRAFGYMLTNSTREQGFFCLLGETGTGKSTVVNAITHALGSHVGRGEPSMFLLNRRGEQNGDLVTGGVGAMASKLASRRVIVLEEVPTTGARFDDQRLKQFTAGSAIEVRPPYAATSWEVHVAAKILWLMNELPGGDSSDPSLGRRMRLIRADEKVSAPLLGLDGLLKAPEHAEAILAWLVEGTALWASQGLGNMPSAWQQALTEARAEADPVVAWFNEELESGEPRHDGERVYARTAWEAFCHWFGTGRHMTRTAFGRRLRGLGVEKGTRMRRPDTGERDFPLRGCRWQLGERPEFSQEQFDV